IGVNGEASNATFQSFGGNFDVLNSNSPQNYGVQVEINSGTNANALNIGGNFVINTPGSSNYGVLTSAFGGTTNYAIYASSGPSSGTTPPSGPNYAGYFSGDVAYTGTIGFVSDINLKQNIN